MAINKITKRSGKLVRFQKNKIVDVIQKASQATGEFDEKEAKRLSKEVFKILNSRFDEKKIPHVEDVQDTVEFVLMREDHYKTAKAFIIYREERRKDREARKALGIKDDLGLPLNTLKVMERRYLVHNEKGKVQETPTQMFRRVAKAIAKAGQKYTRSKKKIAGWEEQFFNVMTEMKFLPGGRVLNSAGVKGADGMLSSCFVLPVGDSMEGIFDSVKWGALLHKAGSGTGYNFSGLRPKGDFIKGSKGFASGPLTFMEVFNSMSKVVALGGRKRGAMMGMLNIDHPDILDFITAKKNGDLSNFNLSVGITDEFMKAAEKGRDYALKRYKTGDVVHKLPAHKVLDMIASQAWKTGDPGMVYLDALQRNNTLKEYEVINAVNVCGEIPLPEFDACNLGSINLEKFVTDETEGKGSGKSFGPEVDWKGLEETVSTAVLFLDHVIDAGKFPIRQITKTVNQHRRLGLGVMGFAEMLIKLRIPYASQKGVKFAEKLMKFIQDKAHDASEELAKERGNFPLWEHSIYAKRRKKQKMRNCAITTVAPTGTISMIPEVTGGIEPVFALAYTKHVVEDSGLFYINRLFEKVAKEKGFYSEDLIEEVANSGSLQNLTKSTSKKIPAWVKKVFVTSMDIPPEWHIRMQAAFQKHVDNSVSKTINMPNDTSIDDVSQAYMLAWKLGCKGVTIYRDGSLDEQILTTGKNSEGNKGPEVQSSLQIVPLEEREFKLETGE